VRKKNAITATEDHHRQIQKSLCEGTLLFGGIGSAPEEVRSEERVRVGERNG